MQLCRKIMKNRYQPGGRKVFEWLRRSKTGSGREGTGKDERGYRAAAQ